MAGGKIRVLSGKQEQKPIFTCPDCGSNAFSVISSEGRVAGKNEKTIVCMKCGRAKKAD